jgi:hypothetical protein
VQRAGKPGPRGALKIGGDHFDIFKMSSSERKKASYAGGKDPLDPKTPRNVLKMFENPEREGEEGEEAATTSADT